MKFRVQKVKVEEWKLRVGPLFWKVQSHSSGLEFPLSCLCIQEDCCPALWSIKVQPGRSSKCHSRFFLFLQVSLFCVWGGGGGGAGHAKGPSREIFRCMWDGIWSQVDIRVGIPPLPGHAGVTPLCEGSSHLVLKSLQVEGRREVSPAILDAENCRDYLLLHF